MLTGIAQSSLLTVNQRLPFPIETSEEYTTLAGAVISRVQRIREEGELMLLNGDKAVIIQKEASSMLVVSLEPPPEGDGGEA